MSVSSPATLAPNTKEFSGALLSYIDRGDAEAVERLVMPSGLWTLWDSERDQSYQTPLEIVRRAVLSSHPHKVKWRLARALCDNVLVETWFSFYWDFNLLYYAAGDVPETLCEGIHNLDDARLFVRVFLPKLMEIEIDNGCSPESIREQINTTLDQHPDEQWGNYYVYVAQHPEINALL